MSTKDIKNKLEPIFDICVLCNNCELIAIKGVKTKACICFKCLGGSLIQMGLQIQHDGEVENVP